MIMCLTSIKQKRPFHEVLRLSNLPVIFSLEGVLDNAARMMDRAHAQAMEQVGAGILQVAEAEERRLDAQLKSLENLGKWHARIPNDIMCQSHHFRHCR